MTHRVTCHKCDVEWEYESMVRVVVAAFAHVIACKIRGGGGE